MVSILRLMARLVVAGSVVLLAAGYGGALHPAGDSLAVFGGLFVLTGWLALVFAGWSRALTAGLAVVLALAMGPRLADWLTTGPGVPGRADVTLYQKNLHWPRGDRAPLLADIAEVNPDIITLQEITPANQPVLAALRGAYPAQVFCPFETYGGIAIVSRLPAVQGSKLCLPKKGLAALQLATAQGPVWAVAIHLHWPWPFQQAEDITHLLPVLENLDGPILIGGDFNMVLRSNLMTQVMTASGTSRPRPVRPTFNLPLFRLGITIDHVLIPPGGVADIISRPKFASDHRGVVARIGLPARRP